MLAFWASCVLGLLPGAARAGAGAGAGGASPFAPPPLGATPAYDGYSIGQVHLAQGKTPESMMVMWAGGNGADVYYSQSLDGASAPQRVKGLTESYGFDYPGAKPYSSPLLHSALLTGLAPRQRYYYKCGDAASDTFSGWMSFTTLPEPGDLSQPLSFALIGDLGATNDSVSTLGHIIANPKLAMILHAGDLGYADCDAPVWDSYAMMTQDLASARPWQVGPGNHEIEFIQGSDGRDLYKAFEARYKMPQVKPSEMGKITYGQSTAGCCPSKFQSEYNFGNSFYSLEAGAVHVVYANAYSTSDPESAQYKWLEGDLSQVDRNRTPWILVIMHCPWYNSNTDHHDEPQTVEMRSNMEALFYKHHVNAVFAGHVHAFERSRPVFQNVTDARGTTYINIGDAGNAEGHSSSYYEPAPSWSAFRNGTQFGHGELEIYNSTFALWTWHRNVDGEPVVRDSVGICNSAFGSAVC